MKTSQVFKQAKKYLWDGEVGIMRMEHSPYICHAIEDVAVHNAHQSYYMQYTHAKRIIRQRIAPHYDLENWVRANVRGSYKVLNKAGGAKQLQAYRHRWLDSLIEEFESKGD